MSDYKMKKLVLVLIVIVLAMLAYAALINHSCAVSNIGNKSCPVSGRPVDGKSTYTLKGKCYNLCSPNCAEPLARSPESYVDDDL
jgi:YHS domain-containing protein